MRYAQLLFLVLFPSYLSWKVFLSAPPFSTSDFPHQLFHRAIFYAERLPQDLPARQLLIELGSISSLVVSGLHFQIFFRVYRGCVAFRGGDLAVASLLLAFWQLQIPVLRAYWAFLLSDSRRSWYIGDPYLRSALSMLLCTPALKTPYDFHSLWLSALFASLFTWLPAKTTGAQQSLTALVIFLFSPFVLPFTNKLHILSFFSSLFFLPFFIYWLFLSPFLHWIDDSLCARYFAALFQTLEHLSEAIPWYHPWQSGGKNLCLLWFFTCVALWQRRCLCWRKRFFY